MLKYIYLQYVQISENILRTPEITLSNPWGSTEPRLRTTVLDLLFHLSAHQPISFQNFWVTSLSPLRTYDFSINNSKHFVQHINEIQCDDNNFLVSFNVKSLFTCIPVPDVLRIIENLLLNGAMLAKCTKLSVANIMSTLKLWLQSTIFTFKNVLYRQICGAPMGSCISLVVANISIEYAECQALTSFREPPKIWINCIWHLLYYQLLNNWWIFCNILILFLLISSSQLKYKKIDHCHSWMFKLPAMLTIHFELPYIKNPHTPTDIYSLTPITLATTSLLLPRACLIEWILI